MIVGMMAVATLNSLGAATKSSDSIGNRAVAAGLADELMSEIVQHALQRPRWVGRLRPREWRARLSSIRLRRRGRLRRLERIAAAISRRHDDPRSHQLATARRRSRASCRPIRRKLPAPIRAPSESGHHRISKPGAGRPGWPIRHRYGREIATMRGDPSTTDKPAACTGGSALYRRPGHRADRRAVGHVRARSGNASRTGWSSPRPISARPSSTPTRPSSLALLTMKQDTNWRTTYSNGNWFVNRSTGSRHVHRERDRPDRRQSGEQSR